MDKQQAQQLLGLSDSFSPADVADALTAKRAQISQKRDAAPTEALKAKFDQLLAQLDQAEAALRPANKPSPLSHTKLADLPSMAAGDAEQLALQSGQVLAARYEVKELLGQGGMGAVYRAFDRSMSRDIALKVLLPSLIKNDNARERFLNEARISQQLSHPNIVNVFDVQNDGDLYFLTMELLEGQDLRQVMENRKLARQPFSVEEAQDIARALSDALGYAHKYTIHRDLKPENVWLTDEGVYKLMDFGIAQVQSTSQRTKTGAAMGTAYYMAPEQLKGQKDIDGRADQYALAVMLYELLSGEVPAGMIEPLGQLRKDVPKSMVAAVHQALAAKPENRFATLTEFTAALTSKRSSAEMPSLPWKPIGIAAGLLVAVIGVGGVLSSGSVDFKSLLPKSQKEISLQRAELAKLAGQIKATKQKLETGRRNLDSDLRDAERTKSPELARFSQWQKQTENGLFNGSAITELEGELAQAESLERSNNFAASKLSYQKVQQGYNQLLNEFNAAGKLYGAAEQSAQAKQRWTSAQSRYNLQSGTASTNAAEQEQQAGDKERLGEFSLALQHWQQATTQWQEALGNEQVQGQIRRFEASAKEAEVKRAAEAKQQQQALLQRAVGKLVTIPAGRFQMGSNDGSENQQPIHSVSIQGFKMQEHEVTFAQWDACVAAGGCSHKPEDEGWGRGNRPVINVSYDDITQQFIPWLNKGTGQRFRLPSEAEWEYAARAGSSTKYSWGDSLGSNRANCDGCGSQWDNSKTAPVKSFAPNAFGLYDMHGNVWQYVQDCLNESYSGAPSNGSAWQSGDCSHRMLRGGSWTTGPNGLLSAFRNWSTTASSRGNNLGFRLVQDL